MILNVLWLYLIAYSLVLNLFLIVWCLGFLVLVVFCCLCVDFFAKYTKTHSHIFRVVFSLCVFNLQWWDGLWALGLRKGINMAAVISCVSCVWACCVSSCSPPSLGSAFNVSSQERWKCWRETKRGRKWAAVWGVTWLKWAVSSLVLDHRDIHELTTNLTNQTAEKHLLLLRYHSLRHERDQLQDTYRRAMNTGEICVCISSLTGLYWTVGQSERSSAFREAEWGRQKVPFTQSLHVLK